MDKENVEKAVVVDNKIRINFFKKIWYSIAKPNKYDELREEGIWSAIKYFFTILGILALIIAIISTVIQLSVVKDAISYLDKNLPEMKFKDNQLSIQGEEAVILDDDEFKTYFGSIAVINPLIEEKQAIDEYKSMTKDKYNVIVFLKDEYVAIKNNNNPENEETGIEKSQYKDVSSKFIKDDSAEYGKEHVVSYFRDNASFMHFIGQYFTLYVGLIGIIFIFYILIITISIWLVTKVSKIKWEFKKTFANTIYSSTLSLLIYVAYMLISYFAKFTIPYMDIISILFIFIYLFIQIYIERKNLDKNKESS